MNPTESQESQDAAEDMPQVSSPAAAESAGSAVAAEGPEMGGQAPGASGEAALPEGKDLLSEENLKAIMIQFNPHSFKDITTIQKGVENFFLFAQSHLALTHPEQLQHLGEKDLLHLEERGAIEFYEYLKLSEDRSRLSTKKVVIRPASLKADQVAKVKLGCVRGSVVAVLEYIHERDRKLRELEAEGQLGAWLNQRFLRDLAAENGADFGSGAASGRAELNKMIPALRNLSFDGFLANEVKPRDDLLIPVLSLLGKRSEDLLSELAAFAKISEAGEEALRARIPRSLLIPLAGDFQVLSPAATDLISMPDAKVKETRSEIEYIYVLYVQMARKILFALLPREETGWISGKGVSQDERYLEELKKHASFTQGDQWVDGATFLQCYSALIRHVRSVREVRKEFLIDLVAQETVYKLNMQFEPVLLRPDTFEVADSSVDSYLPREELYKAVCEKMKSLEDVAFMEERRTGPQAPGEKRGVYFIFRANLAQAFIRFPNRRNYIQLFCRSNSMSKGIYDLLIDVNEGVTPEGIVDEQIALARAIREWEDEQEKERLKKERAGMGLIARLVIFFRNLFGMGEIAGGRRSDDPENSGEGDLGDGSSEGREKKGRGGRKKRSKVIKGPREKELVVPARVQKAVDYVERNFKGLIWLDEVLLALNTVKFNPDQVGDMLYYDKYDRYLEVRALINIRRVFISRENEEDPAWVSSTIDYLENVVPQQEEHRALVSYLRAL
ncbi:MAG: hypothetical protein NXI24_01010 [bacterium]|nr:hypothetical protein [bacterium]